MKIASFGWEADQIYGKSVTVTFPVRAPMILRGYQIDLGLMAWKDAPGGMFNYGDEWSEVLFTAMCDGEPANADFGKATYVDATNGKQNLHGFDIDALRFCRAIVKGFLGKQNAVNKAITISGLNIMLPADSNIIMTAGHAGVGPVDFETQGALFYDLAT